MAIRDVRAAMVAALSDGPLTESELIERVSADSSLGRPGPVRDAVRQLVRRSGVFVEISGRLSYLPALVDGTAWTVEVDAELAQQQMLPMNPSLSPIGWWLLRDGADLVDDAGEVIGRVETDSAWLDGVDADVLVGPDGWLDAAAGGWAAVTIRAERLQVSALAAPPAPTQRQSDALRTGFETVATDHDVVLFDGDERPLRYSNADDPVHAALIADREAFVGSPVPPLPDLVAAAGLEQRGSTMVAAGFDWATMETWRRRNRMRVLHGLDDRRIDALMVAIGAWEQFTTDGIDALGPEDEHENAAMLISVMLELDGVAEAFWDEAHDRGGTIDEVWAFAAVVAELLDGIPLGGLGWVEARCRFESGDSAGGIEVIDALVSEGVEYKGVLAEAAATASDRGDAMRALELAHRAGVHEDELDDDLPAYDVAGELARSVLLEVLPYARHRPRPLVGRNDRCPCGSGRKYKSCHLGTERHTLDERSPWLHRKLERYVYLEEGRLIDQLATELAERSGQPLSELRSMPLLVDLVLFGHGVLDEFMEARGWLLPEDEQLLVAQWALVDWGVFEILEVHGDSLRLRNLGSGDVITVVNTYDSEATRVGSVLVGRPVPVGDAYRAFSGFVGVSPALVDAFIAVVDGGDPDTLLAALGQQFSPPRMTNTSGEEMMFHEITWDVGACGDADAVGAALLDAGMHDSGDGIWMLSEDTRSMSNATISVARLDPDRHLLIAETNSDARAERMVALIAQTLPAANLVDDVRRDLDEAREHLALHRDDEDDGFEFGSGSPDFDDPETRAMLDQMLREKEIEWLDLEIPALGGRTPRDAVTDPVGREQVIRLLASMPAPIAGEIGFNPDRIRADLGLL